MGYKYRINKEKIDYIKYIYKLSNSEKNHLDKTLINIYHYINNGDIQPAFVYSVDPLIVSTYNDEIDNILLLEFPNEFAEKYNLKIGDKLLTSNVYWTKKVTNYNDILPGLSNQMRYVDIFPMVLKFLVDDIDYDINSMYSEFHWEYIKNLTYAYFKFSNGKARNGFFYFFKGDKRG